MEQRDGRNEGDGRKLQPGQRAFPAQVFGEQTLVQLHVAGAGRRWWRRIARDGGPVGVGAAFWIGSGPPGLRSSHADTNFPAPVASAVWAPTFSVLSQVRGAARRWAQ